MLLLIPFVAQGADQYASAAFQQQWNTVEAVIPNFWGPLATARNGQTEQYAEGVLNGQPGVRLVQYFDKARMEQTNTDRPVTNGLLTVELKSGQLQIGDNSFQPLNPAFIGIAGDPNVPGPTYASLAKLPEKSPQQTGGVNLGYDIPSQTFVPVTPSTDPAMQFVTYQSDPGGRFGQSIPSAFWDFLQAIPGGWLTTMGYPISPAFAATVQVNGAADARLRAGIPAPRAHVHGEQSGGVPRRVRQHRPALLHVAIPAGDHDRGNASTGDGNADDRPRDNGGADDARQPADGSHADRHDTDSGRAAEPAAVTERAAGSEGGNSCGCAPFAACCLLPAACCPAFCGIAARPARLCYTCD